MYLESIKFKRNKDSEWERGYYVGKTDNCEESTILDSHYQPLPKDEEGHRIWDYHVDTEDWVIFRSPEPEEIIWKNLSNEAKSILEWVESPITDEKMIIEVERNKEWFMPCSAGFGGDVRVNVTDRLFDEIRKYIKSDNDIKVLGITEDLLKFTLADGVKLH